MLENGVEIGIVIDFFCFLSFVLLAAREDAVKPGQRIGRHSGTDTQVLVAIGDPQTRLGVGRIDSPQSAAFAPAQPTAAPA